MVQHLVNLRQHLVEPAGVRAEAGPPSALEVWQRAQALGAIGRATHSAAAYSVPTMHVAARAEFVTPGEQGTPAPSSPAPTSSDADVVVIGCEPNVAAVAERDGKVVEGAYRVGQSAVAVGAARLLWRDGDGHGE